MSFYRVCGCFVLRQIKSCPKYKISPTNSSCFISVYRQPTISGPQWQMEWLKLRKAQRERGTFTSPTVAPAAVFFFFSCLLFNHLPGGFNTSTEMSDTQSLGYPAFDCSDLFPGSHLCDAERCLQGFLDLKITGKVLIRNLPSSAKRLKYILLNLES